MTPSYLLTLLVVLVTFDLCYGAMPTCYLCVTGDCDTDNSATYGTCTEGSYCIRLLVQGKLSITYFVSIEYMC